MALNQPDPRRIPEALRWSAELLRFSEQAQQLEHARAAFLESASENAFRARGWRNRFGWSLALAAVLAAGAAVLVSTRPATLRDSAPSFSVADSSQVAPLPGMMGKELASTGKRVQVLTFWEGSRVHLRPDARARVTALSERGATLQLSEGEIELDITHRPSTAWTVRAGSFEVRVVGTRFVVAQQPNSSSLSVRVREGQVLVLGACLDGAQPVRAGEERVFRCPVEALPLVVTEPTAARSAPPRQVATPSGPARPPHPPALLQTPSDLRKEVDDTATIRSLVRVDPARALQLIQKARLEHPRASLGEERDAFEVLALSGLGRKARAAEKAAQFLRRYPGSSFSAKVQAVVPKEPP